MKKDLVVIFSIIPLAFGMIFFVLEPHSQDAFGLEEDFLTLQTGIISTQDRDFAVSNDFETRVFKNGNIIRLSGITITGEPYYIYQKSIDGDMVLKGKILTDGDFISIIQREIITEPQVSLEPDTQLIISAKLPHHTYASYPLIISVKVFDAEQNPQARYDQSFGVLENVFVNVTITNEFGKFVTSLSEYTDERGLFSESHKVREGIDLPGEYNVNVTIDDGKSSTSQTFKTFFRGDLRDYFDDDT